MKTPDKILATALRLFNEQGTDTITVRHIAKELGISHGNLCYHFPRTEDIIQQLYGNLLAELEAGFQQLAGAREDLLFLVEVVRHTFTVQYAYRFLLLDLVRIMRRIPTLKEQFRVLAQQRSAQVSPALGKLVAKGDFQPEHYPGQHAHFLAHMFLLSNAWIAEAESLGDEPAEVKLATYLRLAYGLLYQFLTPQGQGQLRPLLLTT